ncbi:hypothetical protein TWF730_010993 [Orbilia blumenaviensis]|uniref:Lysine-specific metallo-endopeptidase domain-containing protein n=1 Tax=Orbilia blumenaviensis TaxID=1796055 RepID=A0AAV9UK86_9PEZI
MWGVKRLVFRAVLLFSLLLKPSFQIGIETCFEVVTEGEGACSAADIQLLNVFYNDAVALLRAGISIYDNYKSPNVGTFSHLISWANGQAFFGLRPQRDANEDITNIPEEGGRWDTVRKILSRTQRFLAGEEDILNINTKPYIYCRDWWIERVPDINAPKLKEGIPPSNPNPGGLESPPTSILNAYRSYLFENGVRNTKEVWWNKINREYYVQSPMPEGTLGMTWKGDGTESTKPRTVLTDRVFREYGRRLVASHSDVTAMTGINTYYTGAATLVHEIIHLTAEGQDNDHFYGFGDIVVRNQQLLTRLDQGDRTALQEFYELQYTADAYAWYCLSAYLSSVSGMTLFFATGAGLNAEQWDDIPAA